MTAPLLWTCGGAVALLELGLTRRTRNFPGPPRDFQLHRHVVRASAALLLLRDATPIAGDVQLALLWALSTWWWNEPHHLAKLLAHVANAVACLFAALSRHSARPLGLAVVLARDAVLLALLLALGARSFHRHRCCDFRFVLAAAAAALLLSHALCAALVAADVGAWVDGAWRALALGAVLAHDHQTWSQLRPRLTETGVEVVAV